MADKVEKEEISVRMKLHNGDRLYGSIFGTKNQRIQDIMNDDRQFLPLHVSEGKMDRIIMVSKKYILTVE